MSRKPGRPVRPDSIRQQALRKKQEEEREAVLQEMQAEKEKQAAELAELRAQMEEMKSNFAARNNANENNIINTVNQSDSENIINNNDAENTDYNNNNIYSEISNYLSSKEPETLADMLNIPTENKPEANETPEEAEQPETVILREKTEEEEESDAVYQTAPNPSSEAGAEPGKVKFKMPTSWTAKQIVSGIEGVSGFIFPLAYQAVFFSPEEMYSLKKINRQEKHYETVKGKQRAKFEIVLEEEDLEALRKFDQFEKYESQLPFTAEERKSLIEPLEYLLDQNGVEISPGWAFAIAMAFVMGSRTAPILMQIGLNWLEKREKQQQEMKEKEPAPMRSDSEATKYEAEVIPLTNES